MQRPIDYYDSRTCPMPCSLREALESCEKHSAGDSHVRMVCRALRRAVKDTERIDWLTKRYFFPAHTLGSRKKIDAVIRAENKPANLRIPLPIADLTTELRPRRKRG